MLARTEQLSRFASRIIANAMNSAAQPQHGDGRITSDGYAALRSRSDDNTFSPR